MRSRSRLVLGLLLLASASGCTPSSPQPLAVELRDLDAESRVVKRVPLQDDGVFALRFTHSMYGGSVEELFRAGETESVPVMVRSRIWTAHAGAAEYYARYGEMRPDTDGWLVEVPPLILSRLPVRVDRVGNPELVIDGVGELLLESVPDGHLVELRVVGGTRR